MGKFFQSEMVRGDIQEMATLQEYCFKCAMNMVLLNKEQKLEYFEALEMLIEKQKLFYLRVHLSEDEEAQSVCENMKQAVVMLGGDASMSVLDMFDDLMGKLKVFKQLLEAEGD